MPAAGASTRPLGVTTRPVRLGATRREIVVDGPANWTLTEEPFENGGHLSKVELARTQAADLDDEILEVVDHQLLVVHRLGPTVRQDVLRATRIDLDDLAVPADLVFEPRQHAPRLMLQFLGEGPRLVGVVADQFRQEDGGRTPHLRPVAPVEKHISPALDQLQRDERSGFLIRAFAVGDILRRRAGVDSLR